MYNTLTDRRGHEVTEDGTIRVPFVATDEEGTERPVSLAIDVLGSRAVRVTLFANAHGRAYDSPVPTDLAAFDDPDVTVEETDDGLRIGTDAVTLVVGDDGSLGLHDDDGTIVGTTTAVDIKGRVVARDLGFTERREASLPRAVDETHLSLALDPDEAIYGGGERFGDLDLHGRTTTARVEQGAGTAGTRSYKPVPVYLSTAGYGLFVDTTETVTVDVGDDAPEATEIAVDGETLSVVLFARDSLKEMLTAYTALTGRPDVPPRWTFGLWLSTNSYESAEQVRSVLDRADDHDLPVDLIHLDPGWIGLEDGNDMDWDHDAFPDPAELIDDVHARDTRVCLWEYPHVDSDSAIFETARDAGYLVENGRGEPLLQFLSSWGREFGTVDFTDPDAREWWQSLHRPLIEAGVDAFKLDFGEYVPERAVFANGRTGDAYGNAYPLAYQRTVHEAMTAAGVDPVTWNRPGWAGTQRYPIHWSGDPASTDAGLRSTVRAGLNLALSGYQFWSCDLGGYAGTPDDDLYERWAAWGLLGLSHARFHGRTRREPWRYGDDAVETVRSAVRTRYRLLPYLRSVAAEASRTGLPVVRPPVLEHPDDPALRSRTTEHYVGDALFIAPLVEDVETRTLYLPPGDWADYWTGERLAGGRDLTRDVEDRARPPLFVRVGEFVPVAEPGDRAAVVPETITLLAYRGEDRLDAKRVVYDEGRETGVSVSIVEDEDGLAVRTEGTITHELEIEIRGAPDPGAVRIDGEAVDYESDGRAIRAPAVPDSP